MGLSGQLLRDLMPAVDDVSVLAARLYQRRRRKAREATSGGGRAMQSKTGTTRANLEGAIALGRALAERDLRPLKLAAAQEAAHLGLVRRLGLSKVADPGYFSDLAERLRGAGTPEVANLLQQSGVGYVPSSSDDASSIQRKFERNEGTPSNWLGRRADRIFAHLFAGEGEEPYVGTRTPQLRGRVSGVPSESWRTTNWVADAMGPGEADPGETMIKTESPRVKTGSLKVADPGYFSDLAERLRGAGAAGAEAPGPLQGPELAQALANMPSTPVRPVRGNFPRGGVTGMSAPELLFGWGPEGGGVVPGSAPPMGPSVEELQETAARRPPGGWSGDARTPDLRGQTQPANVWERLQAMSKGGASKAGSLYEQMAQDLPPEKREMFFKIAEAVHARGMRALLRLRDAGLIG